MILAALTALLGYLGLASAQGGIECPALESLSTFHIKDSLQHFYSVSPGANGSFEAATTDQPTVSTFFINTVCYNPQICGLTQLSYNDTGYDGITTTYGAYASTAGGPISFVANGTDVSGYSLITALLSTYQSPDGCYRLFLSGFLNKYLSYPATCDNGDLSIYSYGPSKTGAGCQSVNLTVRAV